MRLLKKDFTIDSLDSSIEPFTTNANKRDFNLSFD